MLTKQKLRHLKNEYGQLWLDAGCGFNRQPNCIGMDNREEAEPDVLHDLEDLPYPFPDDVFDRIIMSHVMEHLNPKLTNRIMNEMWRIMKVGGALMLAMPYAGSFGHYQDPTHIKPWNEATATYYDPTKPLYQIYRPKPWHIEVNVWRMPGNIEIVLRKMSEKGAATILAALNGGGNGAGH